jgi:NAD+ kinase
LRFSTARSTDSVTPSSTAFHRVAVIAKPDDSQHLAEVLQSVRSLLDSRGIELLPDRQTARLLDLTNGRSLAELAAHADLGIVVGGDGTLLSAAREFATHEIPVLGVNLGRLGFLVDITPTDIHACLNAVFDGHYDAESRFLLNALVGDGTPHLAFNDVVLHKWNIARMIEFETWIDGRFVYTQRSDGLIISTPTGSTAYALSGGGPLMTPDLDAVALVPICPHTLSNRPIVVAASSVIEISVCGQTDPGDVRITCDGASHLTLQDGERVTVSRHPTAVRLLHPVGHDHFDVLRAKLGWGELPKH